MAEIVTPPSDGEQQARRNRQFAAEILSDLSELADEIEGVTLPPGMVGTYAVTLHTTGQVQLWLQRYEDRVRESGWKPWGDICSLCHHPEQQHDDGGCMYPRWDKNGGTTCTCAAFDPSEPS